MTQNTVSPSGSIELEQEITILEQEIADFKHRHQEVELGLQEQIVLLRQQNELKSRGRSSASNKQELQQIRSRLEELDFLLESKLLNLWEPFWQAVRFCGLGIIIGWLLCSWYR